MKRHLLFFLLLCCLPWMVDAQCTTTTANGGITPTTSWQLTGMMNGRNNKSFFAISNAVYEFSFCAAQGGGSSTFDTEITILDASGASVGYNDNFCGNQSYISWTCPVTGTYRVNVSKKTCATQANLGNLAYKCSAISCPGNLGTGVINVPSLPYASGAGSTTGQKNDLQTGNMPSCGNGNYLGGEDRVWIFTPSVTGFVTIALSAAGNNNGLKLYRDCPVTIGTCVASANGNGNQSLTNICVTAGVTYYLVVDVYPNPTPTSCIYSNLTISAPTVCPLGTGVVNVATLPYTSTGRTTCGKVNDFTSSNTLSCGNDNYLSGEDEVFVFTPSASGMITIDVTSATGTYIGAMLYLGCPLICGGGSCIGYEQSSAGTKSLCAGVTAGQTYYLIIDSWASPNCNPYNITISAPQGALPGSTCVTAVTIPSLPFVANGETTHCRVNDYTNASTGSCATLYESGEDKVYAYTTTAAECIGITFTGASSNSIGFQVYNGCPGSVGTTCIGNGGGATNGTLSGTVTLPMAGTYYIVVDNQATPNFVNYNISIASFGAGVSNDLPCNAIPLTAGVMYTGSNTCSGSSGEPAAPSCWAPGGNVRHTVWFSVIAPASGKVRVRVIPSSLTNPQAAFYSGTCGASMTILSCNNDTTSCGTTTNYSADLNVSGLTAGNTYYVAVDGYASLTGSFGIMAVDGASPLPPLSNGQDCGTYIQVCDTTLSFGNPGFQSFGNICDFNGSGANCLDAGERGSSWFEVTIAANGILEFSVVPKDWGGSSSTPGSETDYDFAVWKTFDGVATTTTCSDIAGGAVPVRCSYSALGITGVYGASNGIAPPNYPGFNGAFQSQIPVVAGEKYVIVVSNWATSTSGFDLIFGTTSTVQYGTTGNTIYWSGGVDTDWFRKQNWGGCALPSCTRDAIVNGGIILQPKIAAAGAAARNVVINPGATITLQPGFNLSVCGNFTNNGNFSSGSGSTVIFNGGSFNQNIDGNLVPPNNFDKLTVTKTGGLVKLIQNAQLKGDFTVSNGSSSFSLNNKKLFVSGDFNNNGSFIPGASGTLEFNGNGVQNYTNFGTLQNVIVNNTGSGVVLNTDMEVSSTGSLSLLEGNVTTNSNEARVLNRSTGAITGGSATSFIQGNLRRSINSLGAYAFPLGDISKGFEKALIDFNDPGNPTLIDNIVANFQTYSSLPLPLGTSDCGIPYSDPPLDNGYWSFTASNDVTSGEFEMTLFNTGFGNASSHYTIMNDIGFGWSIASGNCVTSTPGAVMRDDMTGLDGLFGTTQGPSPLPVELLSFDATPLTTSIALNWTTLSEKENKGFVLLRSTDGEQFAPITWIPGHGSTNVLHTYKYTDTEVKAGKQYYYRLQQVDMDGTTRLSDVVTARINGRLMPPRVVPNPFVGDADLQFVSSADDVVDIDLYNVQGARVAGQAGVSVQEGANHLSLGVLSNALAPGMYLLTITSSGERSFVSFVVSR